MIVDSSALVAIMLREPECDRLLDALGRAASVAIGAPTLVESAIVLSSRMQMDARGRIARLLQEHEMSVIPLTEAHYALAVEAWLRFGKGRHVAALNFGDCLVYATATLARRPLLCTGDDFTRTDVDRVPW